MFPLTKQKRLQRLSETEVCQVHQSEVRPQIVSDLRSSCTEGSVGQVDVPPTDEKRTSVSRAQSCWAGVGDEAAVVSQLARSVQKTAPGGQVWRPRTRHAAALEVVVAGEEQARCRKMLNVVDDLFDVGVPRYNVL